MNHLGLFAKFWQPGKVKTRLAATIGDTAACVIYQHFLAQLLHQLHSCGDRRTVMFSPPESESAFGPQISPGWDLMAQTTGNLGDRMENFFRQSWQDGSEIVNGNSATRCKTVVIGADTPDLTANEIENAFEHLDRHAAVIGECHDGGYYLIGFSQSVEGIFDDVQWSSGYEFQQTMDNLARQSIDVCRLPVRNDIDDYEDLMRYRNELYLNKPLETAGHCLTCELIDSIICGPHSEDAACNALLRGPLE